MNFKQVQLKSDDLFLNDIFKDMLKDQDIIINDLEYVDHLSKTQKKAFELFKSGSNVLLLGPGGTGKSKTLKTFEEYTAKNKNKRIYLTATTGIAAYNIGGMTINAFMGIGSAEKPKELLLKNVKRNTMIKDRILSTDILIIDEASMMSAELFEKMNYILQNVRRNNNFFGGIQMVFSGDFLQLLPVFKDILSKMEIESKMDTRLIVESDLFKKIFTKKNTIVLKENFRQKDQHEFIEILSRIRTGEHTEKDITLLQTRKITNVKHIMNINKMIHLVTSNRKAQRINDDQLSKLSGPEYISRCKVVSTGENKELCDILQRELSHQFSSKGLDNLILKMGARVMLVKNLDVSNGLINGSMGTIKMFEGHEHNPVIEFDNGVTQKIEKTEWSLEVDNHKASVIQFPLILSYAITTHKSQSLTLTHAVLDLEDCFCDHQVYVALSRVQSLDGIYLKSFDSSKITVNPIMKEFLMRV
jgi:ATP-dependent DNA helicase PIF1